MQEFFSWVTSHSGVSLLVAVISLFGALFVTWCNNKAADKRRIADQAAADRRRKEDQAAEDARRKDDDDRRERERREQLQREDWARQRRAVADLLAVFQEKFPPLGNLRVGISVNQDVSTLDIYIDKGLELLAFYRAIVRSLNVAELEVSDARVKTSILGLMDSCKAEYGELLDAENKGHSYVGEAAMKMNAIGPNMEKSLRNLVNVTSRELINNSRGDDNDE